MTAQAISDRSNNFTQTSKDKRGYHLIQMQVVKGTFVCLQGQNINDWLTENDEARSLVAQLNLLIAVVQTMIGSHLERLKGGMSQGLK